MAFNKFWKLSTPILAVMLAAACSDSQDEPVNDDVSPEEVPANGEMNTEDSLNDESNTDIPTTEEITPEEPTNEESNTEVPSSGENLRI